MIEQCPAIAAVCTCRYMAGHEGPHECADVTRCDGAWEGSEPTVTPLRMPKRGALGLDILEVMGWENKLPYTDEAIDA